MKDWVFKGESNGNGCSTQKLVKLQCRTEEVQPGRYVRKCEKTEQIFKICVGRPCEMVQSNKEYTEEDVTGQMVKESFPFDSVMPGSFLPGMHRDMNGMKRKILGNISRVFEALGSVGIPRVYDDGGASSHKKREVHVEVPLPKEGLNKNNSDGEVDLSGLVRDV